MPRGKRKTAAVVEEPTKCDNDSPEKKQRTDTHDTELVRNGDMKVIKEGNGSVKEKPKRRAARTSGDADVKKKRVTSTDVKGKSERSDIGVCSPVKKLKARKECDESKKVKVSNKSNKQDVGSDRSRYFNTGKDNKPTRKQRQETKPSNVPQSSPESSKAEISLISDSDSDSDFEEVSFIAASPRTTNEHQKKVGASEKSKPKENKKPVHSKDDNVTEITEVLPSKEDFENADQSKIADMLLAFENNPLTQNATNSKSTKPRRSAVEESGSDSDWEEVEEGEVVPSPRKSQQSEPTGDVQITQDAPNIMRKKRKKNEFDLEDWFRLQVNRYKKESQIELHKVHLLCLLSHGCHRNKLCRDETLMAVTMSLVPMEMVARQPDTWDIQALNKFTTWFSETFTIDSELKQVKITQSCLLGRLEDQKVASEDELVMMYVLAMRSIGLDARLVCSLQPVTYKASNLKPKKKESDPADEDTEKSTPTDTSTKSQANTAQSGKGLSKCSSASQLKSRKTAPSASRMAETSDNSKEVKNEKNQKTKGKTKNSRPRSCASKVNYNEQKQEQSSSEEEDYVLSSQSEEGDVENVKKGKKSQKGKRGNSKAKGKGGKGSKHKKYTEMSSDEEFEPEEVTYRSPPLGTKSGSKFNLKGKGSKVKVVSSDSDESVKITKSTVKEKGRDCWAEVYLTSKQKWICVDCARARVNHPTEMEAQATPPLQYVVGFDRYGCVKDITRKYARNWMSHTRKLRIDDEWWQIALLPWRPLDAERDSMEDLEIQNTLMKKPLPTSIAEFKNHPMYALKRHLLKFEAIYPDTAVPLGYIRKEPVYARECVHTLHSRQNWVKEARLVRVKEEPYKIVKARLTKKRRAMGVPEKEEPMLELFGYWQTEEYIPPPAYNGKVPRNEYGNVELFKPCMLPAGTVHLQGMPGLNRVAKKLDVDCVAAMTGWDSHGGYSHPVLDGWVVCVEHKDSLLAAWDEEQVIIKEREREKREKRALGNWKLLVKSILIKERLKHRYNLEDPHGQAKKDESEKKKKNAGSRASQKADKATDEAMSWPQNRQNKPAASTSKKKDQGTLFPFEVEEL